MTIHRVTAGSVPTWLRPPSESCADRLHRSPILGNASLAHKHTINSINLNVWGASPVWNNLHLNLTAKFVTVHCYGIWDKLGDGRLIFPDFAFTLGGIKLNEGLYIMIYAHWWNRNGHISLSVIASADGVGVGGGGPSLTAILSKDSWFQSHNTTYPKHNFRSLVYRQ